MQARLTSIGNVATRAIAWSALVPGVLLSATTFAANHVVNANSNMTFTPNTLTIAAGDTVTFHNNGGTHNVRSDPGSVTAFRCSNGCDATGGNGNLSSAAWSATVTFPTAGTIRYFCERHGGAGGVGMSGTLTVTAPIAKRSNFNGDNRSDILWRNASTGANVIWRSASSSTTTAVTTLAVAWRAVGVGDYNGDGRSDILWRNTSTGANVIWRSASSATPQAVASVSTVLRAVGSGDYNGDLRSDILWRNSTSGADVIWRSANSTTTQAVGSMTNLSWSPVGFTE